jgi:hypothetical protein
MGVVAPPVGGPPSKKSSIGFYRVVILGMVFAFGSFMAHSFVVRGNVILDKLGREVSPTPQVNSFKEVVVLSLDRRASSLGM